MVQHILNIAQNLQQPFGALPMPTHHLINQAIQLSRFSHDGTPLHDQNTEEISASGGQNFALDQQTSLKFVLTHFRNN